MNHDSTSAQTVQQQPLRPSTVADLEEKGLLLRILRPDTQATIRQIIANSSPEPHPYAQLCGDQVYISLMRLENETQRRQVFHLVQQYQIGAEVDLSSLPVPLHQLLQPNQARFRKMASALVLSGIAGTAVGVLALAVSILAIGMVELALKVSLDEFSGMRITAVSFVIFAVLGWMLATIFFWRRFRQ